MSSLNYVAFSENMNYIFTNKGVAKLSLKENDLNGKNMVSYTYENLNIAIDILKENVEFRYKTGKLSLLEYTSHPRKFLYQLLEIFKPKDSITIIKEWEQGFGDKLLLINESTDNLLLEEKINLSWESFKVLLEQWYNPVTWAKNIDDYGREQMQKAKGWVKDQAQQIKTKGFTGWAKEKASNVWNKVKEGIASAWKCVTSNPVECIMEGIRSLTMTAAGAAVMTGVSFIPVVGQVSNGIIFGSLLLWDLYKMLSGKYESGKYQWSILDIVVGAVSLLLPALGKVVKTAGVGIKTASQMAKAASRGGVLAKAVTVIKTGLGKLLGIIGKAAKWLGQKLGLKFLENFGSKAANQMTKLTTEISGGTAKVATKKVSSDVIKRALLQNKEKLKSIWKLTPKNAPTKTRMIAAMGKSYLFTAALCAGLGLDGRKCAEKSKKGPQGFTPQEMDTMAAGLKDIELTSL